MYHYTDELDAVVHGIARQVYRKYAQHVAFDDLYQEGRLWALSHPQRVETWLAEDDEKRAWRKLSAAITRSMVKLARHEKAARSGYDPGDEAFYTLSLIETALPAVFDLAYAETGPEREEHEVKVRRDPSIGDNWPIHVADVRRAWQKADLTPRERTLLVLRFGQHHNVADLARSYAVGEDDVAKELRQALRTLVAELGGERPQPPCPPTCQECGNDDATEDQQECLDCLEG